MQMWVLLKTGTCLVCVTYPGPWLHVVVLSGYFHPAYMSRLRCPQQGTRLVKMKVSSVRLQDSKFSFSHSKFAPRPP